MNIKYIITLFLASAFWQLSSAEATTLTLGEAAEYNAIVFGDFTATSSDVEGMLAVQGDVNINHYSVGDKLDSNQLHDTLISAGDVTYPSGRVYYGNILAAGSISAVGSPVSNGMEPGSVIQGNASLPLDFNAVYNELTALSQALQSKAVNTTFEAQWGGLYLHGDCDSDVQVFQLDGTQVKDAHTFQVDCIPVDAYVIFNISGQNPGLTNMSMESLSSHRERVIYNFYEAQSLTLAGIGVEGTILAPDADINNPQGVIKGQLVAQSWNGMMQINNNLFDGQVIPGNQAPVAQDQLFDMAVDEVLDFTLYAGDADGDNLTYSLISNPQFGGLQGTAPDFEYTPLIGFTGIDSFSYQVNDGELDSTVATVTFNVGQTQCELYPYTIEASQIQNLQIGDQVNNYATSTGSGNYSLLTWAGANDTNTLATSFTMPGDSYNYTNPDDASDSEINVNDWVQGAPGKNNARHVRDALDDLIGEEITVPLWSTTRGAGSNFDYQVADFATIELTSYKLNGQSKISFIYHGKAACGNYAPYTLDAGISTEQNVAIDFVLSDQDAIINDVQNLLAVVDADQDELEYIVTIQPAHGTLTGTGPEFNYAPNSGYYGPDSFDFKVNDGSQDSNTSTISIEVIQTNLAPIAFDQNIQLLEDEIIDITLTGEDPDNDVLSFNIESLPSNGQISGTAPDLIYTPTPGFSGFDTLTFTVNDGLENSNLATINIEVIAVNDAPVASDLSLITEEDTAINLTLLGSDPEGDALTYQLVSQSTNGVLSGAAPDLVYTPSADFNGVDTFIYLVNDGQLDSAIATINITVNPVNDAPVAFPISVTTDYNTPIELPLNGADTEDIIVIFTIISSPANGQISETNGVYTYIPVDGFTGNDSATYMAKDSEGLNSSEALISVTVNESNNEPPIILSTPLHFGLEDEDYSYQMVVDDETPETLSYEVAQGMDAGNVSSPEGLFEIKPLNLPPASMVNMNLSCKEPTVNYYEFPFQPKVKWSWSRKSVISMPLVAPLLDTNNDASIDIQDDSAVLINSHTGSIDGGYSTLVALDGKDGTELWEQASQFNGQDARLRASTTPAIGDIDNDGIPEIIGFGYRGSIVSFNNIGEVNWISDVVLSSGLIYGSVSLYDLEGDGQSEILAYNAVLNNQGEILWQVPFTSLNNRVGAYAVDIDNNGDLEVVIGGDIYTKDGLLLNSLKTSNSNDWILSSIIQADDDHLPEIAVMKTARSGPTEVIILDSDWTVINQFTVSAILRGGPPVIADLDGDGSSDISFIGMRGHVAYNLAGEKIWEVETVDGSTGTNGSVAFDFDGDGKMEVVSQDQDAVRVIDGSNGEIIYEQRITSPTAAESPVVADVDGNGHADIVVVGRFASNGDTVQVLQDVEDRWVDTRHIWNQYNYHIDNINDDLSIPQTIEKGWLSHNTFRVNDLVNQDPLGLVDYVISDIKYLDTSGEVSLTVKNRGLKDENEASQLKLYHSNEVDGSDRQLIDTITIPPIQKGESYQVLIETSRDQLQKYLYANLLPQAGECNTENNHIVAQLFEITVTDELGLSDDQLFSVFANNTNEAPSLTLTGLPMAFQGDTYNYIFEANDPDLGDGLRFYLTSGPDGMLINEITGALYWQPEDNHVGTNEITVTVFDNHGLSATQVYTIEVIQSNQSPVSYNQSFQTLQAQLVDITLTADDADADILTYQVQSQPINGQLTGTAPELTYSPDQGFVGIDQFTFTVSDGIDISNIATVSIEVIAVNQSPTAFSNSYSTSENISIDLVLEANDPEGDFLSYQIVSDPPNGRLVGSGSQYTYTPNSFYEGVDSFEFKVNDGELDSDVATVSIDVVSQGNNPPHIISEPPRVLSVINRPIGDPELINLSTWEISDFNYRYDPQSPGNWVFNDDFTTVTQTRNARAGALMSDFNFSNQQISGTFSVQTSGDDDFIGFVFGFQNKYQYYAFAWKKGQQSSQQRGMSLWKIDLATDGSEGEPQFRTTDTEAGIKLYQNDIGWQSFTDYQFNLSFQNEEISISVRNQDNGLVLDAFTIFDDTFTDGPFGFYNSSQPNATYSGFDRQFLADETYYYDVEAIDPDGDVLVYELVNSPPGMTIDSTTGLITWVANTEMLGVVPVSVLVTDEFGATDIQNYDLIVSNDEPVIVSQPQITTRAEEPYAYLVEVYDPNPSDVITYQLLDGPAGMLITENTGQLIWSPEVQDIGIHEISIEVTDTAGHTDTQSYLLEVTAARINSAPVFDTQPPLTATVGRLYTYVPQASDADGDSVTIALDKVPYDMQYFDGQTITWIPTGDQVTDHEVVLVAVDPWGDETEQRFSIQVIDVNSNRPPDINSNPIITAITDVHYQYQVNAVDPENDVLTYALLQAPQGMVIDENTGLITWLPDATQFGYFDVKVQVNDGNNGFTKQDYQLTVFDQSSNLPPVIASQPPTQIEAGELYTYDLMASDPDGGVLTYTLLVSPQGMTIDPSTGRIEWLTTAADTGLTEVMVEVRDIENAFAQQSFSIQVVTDTTGNQPPVINSSPALSATVNSTYIYDVIASDPDLDVLRYTLINAPAGMQINSDTGSVVWTPTSAQIGVSEVEILVEDLQGGSATQVYSISVFDSTVNNPPSLTSTPGNLAKVGLIYGYQVEASDPDGDVLNYQILSGPTDMVIDINGFLSWTPSNTDSQDVVIRVDDGEYFIDQGWTVLVLDGDVPLTANVLINPNPVIEGNEVTVQVEVLNAVDPVNVVISIDGNLVTLDEQYSITFAATGVGSHTVDVTVTDAYETVTESTTYTVTSETPSDLPEVDILSPTDGAIITGFNDISVRVQDDNLDSWRLSYRYAEDDFTGRVTLAEGSGNIDDAVVANWDTSLLRNGIYVLLIEATDLSGQRSSIVHSVFLEGDLKLGHFSIAFEDMNIPVAGIPITITRGYDTRDRNRDRAFGKGWSIGFESVRVQESRIPGLGWFMETGFFFIGPARLPRYCIQPAVQPLVSVVLPDGEVEKFRVKARTANPSSDELSNCQNITPPDLFGVEFIPQGDTNSTLTSTLGSSGLRVINGNLEMLAENQPIDPNQYTLTMLNGTEYALDQGFNVRRIKATTGHELRFTEDGIEHSGGLSVSFIRDTEGRITRIEKANGEGVDYTYNTDGDLVSFTDLNGNTTTYNYIQDHYLEDIIDPRGIRVARNEYDADGRLVAHIDANGNRIEYDNDLINMTSTITDRRGNSTVNAFDNAGNIIAQTNALGETTSYEYNHLRLETARTNHLGHRTEWTYDSQGNQLTEKDPLGHTTTSTYNRKAELLTQTDAQGNPTITNVYNPDYNPLTPSNPQNGYAQLNTVTDALGRSTQFHWVSGFDQSTDQSVSVNTGYTDAVGNRYDITPISGGTNDGLSGASTDLNGLRTETTYDDEARPLTETQIITDEQGNTVAEYTSSYEYNANGDVIRTTDALGNVTETEYNALNKVSATIDALGRRNEMEYDDRGNQVLTRYPDGSTETMVYDEENNVIETTDRAGRTTKTIYDALNRVEAVIYPDDTPLDDSDNPMTVNSYDGAGRLVAVSDARGNTTTYEYDAAGRRTSTIDALGKETSSVYDALGRRTQSTDALGRVTTFEYNALGNLTRTNFANDTFNTVEYDQLSRKVGETDLAGLLTEYEYDAAGNLVAVIDVLNQRTEYTYDQRGNKLTQTDANDNTTSWTYDALNRVTSRTLPMGEVETYAYDAVGNRISKTDFNGDLTTYEHNNLNQLVLTTYADLTTVVNTYTITGQMHTVTEVNGTTTYLYDAQERLIRIEYPTGNYIEYQYDQNGNRTQVHTANQTVDYTFDQLNRLKTVTDASGTTTYAYDAVGNRASQLNANGTRATYTYDDLNRLTDLVHIDSLNTEIASYSYELGPNGNRLSLTEATGRVVEYDYDDLYRLLSETVSDPINGNHFSQWSYDPVGNRLQQDIDGVVTTYSYNDNDHLITKTENAVVTSYVYDDNGNTLSKSVDATVDTSYSYSKDNRMLTADTGTSNISYTYDAGGIRQSQTVDGMTTHYLVDPNRSYHQVLEEQDSLFIPQVVYTYGDDLINQTSSQGVHTFGYDGLGSTRILTDVNGVVQNSYGYQAFGELDYQYGTIENNYLFTGEQYDNNVGFYYLRARFYNPSIGRFHSMDTFPGMQFEPLSLHKYLYTHADPVNNIDPSGYISLVQFSVARSAFTNVLKYAVGTLNTIERVVDTLSFASSIAQAFRSIASGELEQLIQLYSNTSGDSEFEEKISFDGLQRAINIISSNSPWLIKSVVKYKHKVLSELVNRKRSRFVFALPSPSFKTPSVGPIPTGVSIPIGKGGTRGLSVRAGKQGTRLFGIDVKYPGDSNLKSLFRLDWKVVGNHYAGDSKNFDYKKFTGENEGYEIHIPRN